MISCHFAQLADKGVIGFHLVRGWSRREPREGYLRVRDFQWQVSDSEGFLDKTTLGGNECLEIFQIAVGDGEAAELAKKTLIDKDSLAKKSMWIFGGDGC